MPKFRHLLICLLAIAVVGGLAWLLFPTSKILAQSEMKDERGFPYTLKVTSLGERYRMDLTFNHKSVISSYEIYLDSNQPKSAVILWPKLHEFTVTFDTGDMVLGSWDDYRFHWDNGHHPADR